MSGITPKKSPRKKKKNSNPQPGTAAVSKLKSPTAPAAPWELNLPTQTSCTNLLMAEIPFQPTTLESYKPL